VVTGITHYWLLLGTLVILLAHFWALDWTLPLAFHLGWLFPLFNPFGGLVTGLEEPIKPKGIWGLTFFIITPFWRHLF